MNDKELSLKIAEKIFDRIERDKTLILQNIADVVLDELLLRKAKDASDKPENKPLAKAKKRDDVSGELEHMRKIIADSLAKSTSKSWFDMKYPARPYQWVSGGTD